MSMEMESENGIIHEKEREMSGSGPEIKIY